MLCILVFIIFLILYPILGIFSKDYRDLFKKAWQCAFKKVTLKPCDIDFGEEVKNKLLGKIIFKYPKFGRFLDKTATLWALLFIVVSVWSLLYVLNGALNLWVYDTCNPTSGESCALGGEACSIDNPKAPSIIDTIKRIPDRLKNWKAQDYTGDYSTYYYPYDTNKPTAVEIIDPGCHFCKKLWGNITRAKFEEKYNMTYIVYPIPQGDGYKFKHSYVIASYMEAVKLEPLNNAKTPADWQLLNKIFTANAGNTDLQTVINGIYTKEQVVQMIHESLKEFGYTDEQIAKVDDLATSQEVKDRLTEQKNIVENEIKTVKIPTIIFGGKRYDRVVEEGKLK